MTLLGLWVQPHTSHLARVVIEHDPIHMRQVQSITIINRTHDPVYMCRIQSIIYINRLDTCEWDHVAMTTHVKWEVCFQDHGF